MDMSTEPPTPEEIEKFNASIRTAIADLDRGLASLLEIMEERKSAG